jgi:NAD(P)-dependent dehydrogenase (short-subunit alcohol dehydrogenase family)
MSPNIMVITGASTGVGRAAALRFAEEGYVVCALARNAEKLGQLMAEGSGTIVAYPTDVSQRTQVEDVFTKILAKHGRIDVLINNAGVTAGSDSVIDSDPIDLTVIDRLIDTNLKGAMYCTFAALPTMRKQGGGHVINVASIAGFDIVPQGDNGLYTASKHGMVAFSEALGKVVRRDGILVTALCPGGIDTPLWNEENPYPHGKDTMIKPEEVADLIAYILAQPPRTLFKNVVFVPVVEQW